jgi:hypothetical protein
MKVVVNFQMKLSPVTKSVYDTIRNMVPFFTDESKARYEELASVRTYLIANDLY